MTKETYQFLCGIICGELNGCKGTLILYEHQLTLPEELRTIPAEELDEDIAKNLRVYKAKLETTLKEIDDIYMDISP